MHGSARRFPQLIGCIAFAITVVIAGCGTLRPDNVAPCIKPSQTQLLVKWGTKTDSATAHSWYELDAYGVITEVARKEGGDTSRKELVAVDQMLYCSRVQDLNTALLKTQALHSPGTLARYIEYANPASTVYLRAVWNPELQTFQSRDMRAQFDSLMTLVPKE